MTFKRESPPFIFFVFIFLIFLISIIPTKPLLGCLVVGLLAVAVSLPFMAFIYPGYLHTTKKQAWKNFATSNGFNFDKGNFFRKATITGNYQGYDFEIDTYLKPEILLLLSMSIKGPAKLDYSPYTRIKLAIQPLLIGTFFSEPKNVREIVKKLKPKTFFRGQIVAKPGQLGLFYEHKGFEFDEYYLLSVLQTLSELADVYVILLALGGEIVPILLQTFVVGTETLQPIIIQLLSEIEQKTTELKQQASTLICPKCLVHYGTHTINLPQHTLNFYGCRVCSQSRTYLRARVVATLDKGMTTEQIQRNGLLRVNWLVRRALFDFDEVQIINATDEEVERFAVQVGNDTDLTRKPRYKHMRCKLGLTCQLTENTLRILHRTFGEVEVR